MKERETAIDGRTEKRFKSNFQPDILLLTLNPIIPNISPAEINQRIKKRSSFLERKMGLNIDRNHQENMFLAVADDDMLGVYLVDACRYPLITADQEQFLAQTIVEGKRAIYSLQVFGWSLKECDQAIEAAFDGTVARQLLINCNLRLVVSIAWKRTGRGVPFTDLIQAGNLRLMQIVEGFRPNNGKFSSYAKPAIERALKKEIAKNGYIFRLPANQERLIRRMCGLREHLIVKLGREPTDEEIAARLEIDPKKVRWLQEISQQTLSLDVPLFEDERSESLYGIVEDENSVDPKEEIARQDIREQVGKIVASLPDLRERQIIEMHRGLNGFREYTLDEIGEEFGICGERVRQIEVEVLGKLFSHPAFRRKLRVLL